MYLFINNLWENPTFFFMQIFVVIFAICCHEYMHARVALWQGDSTAADAGHLTLNPLRQMGPMSLVMLAIIGIAWGQVPVNPSRMRHRHSDALVSFAGPATNLVLAILFCIIAALIIVFAGARNPGSVTPDIAINAVQFFFLGAMLNFVLFVFNLLPVPGFDGWHILSSFFPQVKTVNSQAVPFISLVILLLAFKFSSYLFLAGNLISRFMINEIVDLAQMLGA